MQRKHWSNIDFVQTGSSPAYDGSDAINRTGYCRQCHCDMQSFGGDGKDGAFKHYSSHYYAKQAGVWVTSKRGR